MSWGEYVDARTLGLVVLAWSAVAAIWWLIALAPEVVDLLRGDDDADETPAVSPDGRPRSAALPRSDGPAPALRELPPVDGWLARGAERNDERPAVKRA